MPTGNEKSAALRVALSAFREKKAADIDKSVVFDFDGVIHAHDGKWKGTDVIEGDLIPGVKEELARIRNAGYNVTVVSARCGEAAGLKAVKEWLKKQDVKVDKVQAEKPPAKIYLDDRAMRFDGDPAGLLERIKAFRPWHHAQQTKTASLAKAALAKVALFAYCDVCNYDSGDEASNDALKAKIKKDGGDTGSCPKCGRKDTLHID